MQDRWLQPTLTYAACHFVVDLTCISTVLGAVSRSLAPGGRQAVALAVLAYNLVAFCLQLPVGALLDRMGRDDDGAAVASCALVAAGVLASLVGAPVASWLAVLLVALGNAGFHCAGGIEVLDGFPGRATPPGVFIATGAAGVFLGGKLAQLGAGRVAIGLLGLLAACVLLIRRLRLMRDPAGRHMGGKPFLPVASTQLLAACALLAVTVALRSYAGMVMAFPWKAEPVLATAVVAGVVAGKATGGVVADRWGLRAASLASLAGAAALFLLSWHLPAAGVAATFLFNFTMPVTLVSLAELMPGSRGLAFGIASFSLAIGALPALLGYQLTGPLALCGLSVASLVALLAGLALSSPVRTAGDM